MLKIICLLCSISIFYGQSYWSKKIENDNNLVSIKTEKISGQLTLNISLNLIL